MLAAAPGICGCGRDSAIAIEIYILWDGVLNYHFEYLCTNLTKCLCQNERNGLL